MEATLGDQTRLAEETALWPWGSLDHELPTRVGEFRLEAGLDISAGSREAHPRP